MCTNKTFTKSGSGPGLVHGPYLRDPCSKLRIWDHILILFMYNQPGPHCQKLSGRVAGATEDKTAGERKAQSQLDVGAGSRSLLSFCRYGLRYRCGNGLVRGCAVMFHSAMPSPPT